MDSGRLAALAAAQGVPNLNAGAVGVSSAHVQLAQLDAQIAQESARASAPTTRKCRVFLEGATRRHRPGDGPGRCASAQDRER